ncbi:Alpha/Beta hydrolase protein [Xylaria sp. FL0064]|nr:Alpha/Beta hydrolase protein [Xylaria sp. FL0064]
MAFPQLLTAGFFLFSLLLVGASLASPVGFTPLHSALAPAACGCSEKGEAGVSLNKRINETLAGSGRRYLLWVPPSYTPRAKTPVIFSFHGATKTPDAQADLDLLTTPRFNADHIVVYPSSGEYGEKRGRYWQGAPQTPPDVDDVAYVLDILDALESRFCVDTARVYATGKSQGGLMVNNLACDPRSSARIAAFAPVSGSYYVNATGDACTPLTLPFPNCRPAERRNGRVPLLIFHGGADVTIPYAGGPRSGECLPYIPHFAAAWAARDGLDGTPGLVWLLAGAADNATVYEYGDGEGLREGEGLVRFVYSGNHVNHQWPATIQNADSVEYDSAPATFNASSVIVDFFRRYTL